MTHDIKMPQVEKHKVTVKRILQFKSGTIFTVNWQLLEKNQSDKRDKYCTSKQSEKTTLLFYI
jgi:hypothetical protein